MKIKWEQNSVSADLCQRGKIHADDIIYRTTTDNFPVEAVTVRMKNLSQKIPHVTLHIRGKATSKQTWNGRSYEYAPTCRINFGGSWQGKVNTAMDSNGDLAEDLTWLDVHNAVTEVKDVMEIS